MIKFSPRSEENWSDIAERVLGDERYAHRLYQEFGKVSEGRKYKICPGCIKGDSTEC